MSLLGDFFTQQWEFVPKYSIQNIIKMYMSTNKIKKTIQSTFL